MSNTSNSAQGKGFERQVASLFRLLGFSVEIDVLIGGRQVDLRIDSRSGPLSRTYIVECKNQSNPVTTAQYDSFRGRLMAAKSAISPKVRGIIVASVGFVKEIKAQSAHDDIELFTISELETSLIDFRPYVQTLIQRLENDTTLEYFVEPNLKREHLVLPQAAYAVLNEWLSDPSANHMTILGDYGVGKTTLLKHLALTMAKKYQQEVLEEGARGRVPLLVDLRDYTHAISLKQIILDLLDSHSIRPPSYGAFEYVSSDGQLLLMLDGFDEMASRGNYETTLRNFRELNRSAVGRAKIILSCRTHYFTTQEEVRKFHGQPLVDVYLPKAYTDLYREIATRPNFLIVYLMEFEPDQVQRYLRRRCGERWGAVQAFIDSTYNLTELSRKPVLLDMIVATEGRVSSDDSVVTPGILYQVYTDIWLSKNDWSALLNVSTKLELLERFAYLAASNPNLQLHYKAFPELIKSWKDDISELDAIDIDRELRTASFLVRDQAGNYKFSHKSFLEFFLARYLLAQAVKDNKVDWASGFFTTEVYRFIRDLLPTMPLAIEALINWVNDTGLPDFIRTNAIKCSGGIQQAELIEALLKALESSTSTMIRRSAATALGYYLRPDVVGTLITRSVSDGDPTVRGNCLLALGRLKDPKGLEFLISIITGTNRLANLDSFNTWAFYRAARDFKDDYIVEECVRSAPTVSKDRHVIEACLDLCRDRWSQTAEDYCIKVIEITDSVSTAAIASSMLALSKKKRVLPKLLRLLNHYEKGQLNYAEALLRSLQGVMDNSVEEFLCEKVTKGVNLGISPRIAIAAIDVLAADYPQSIVDNAKRWMQRGKSKHYSVRIRVAEEYGKIIAEDRLPDLITLLAPNERPAMKIPLLKLIHKYYPRSFSRVASQIWDAEPATVVKRYILELYREIDRNGALTLMLTRGIKDPNGGTRVAVCSILGSEDSAKATATLLYALRYDHSKWVRLQALRSLCSPGRKGSRADILAASAVDPDSDVRALRVELLGADVQN
jgi:HEAT repeat protein/energy-coupling factor transporter ATP-binding protein EcfA2